MTTQVDITCADCGACTAGDWYVVHDQLWREFGAGRRCLHSRCLERRMGRELEPEDLLVCPATTMHPRFGQMIRDVIARGDQVAAWLVEHRQQARIVRAMERRA